MQWNVRSSRLSSELETKKEANFVVVARVECAQTRCLMFVVPEVACQEQRCGVRGRLKRSARAVQLFGRLAVLETHTLRY